MNGFNKTIGYDRTESVSIVPGATATLIEEKIPSGVVMLISHFANYVSDVMAWGSITWRLKVNGNPWSSFDAVKDQLGDPANPRELGNPPIARGGDVLTIEATNAAAVAYSVGVSVKGGFGYFSEGRA